MPDSDFQNELELALEHIDAEGFGDNVDADDVIYDAAREYLKILKRNPPRPSFSL